jgi:hypothetical protein
MVVMVVMGRLPAAIVLEKRSFSMFAVYGGYGSRGNHENKIVVLLYGETFFGGQQGQRDNIGAVGC